MYDNVWELCANHWTPDYYAQSSSDDASELPKSAPLAIRGGGWYFFAWGCRSAKRLDCLLDHRGHNVGFRLAAVLAAE